MIINQHLKKADRALSQTEIKLTDALRTYLQSAGWDSEAASAVGLTYEDGQFSFSFIEGKAGERAATLEYGNEDQRPTGAIRKFLNDDKTIQTIYLAELEKQLGDLL